MEHLSGKEKEPSKKPCKAQLNPQDAVEWSTFSMFKNILGFISFASNWISEAPKHRPQHQHCCSGEGSAVLLSASYWQ